MLSHKFSASCVLRAILLVSLMISFGFMPSGSAPGMANAAPDAPDVPPLTSGISSAAGAVAGAPPSPLAATAVLTSQWAGTPPLVDGVYRSSEWGTAPSITLPHGQMLFQNDGTYLYLFVDVISDTVNDPPLSSNPWGDFFWLTFDVNRDGAITPNVDVNYGCAAGSYNFGRQYYLGPGSWTGILPSQSQFAPGFDISTGRASHRIWEFGIKLTEIQAAPGQLVRLGIRTYSQNPSFDDSVPPNFDANFTSLIEVQLAQPRVAYIYSTDLTTANSFQSLLQSNSFQVDLVAQSAIMATDFSPYSYILIGPETGNLSQWGDAGGSQARRLMDSGHAILGLGEGGYAFFGRHGLDIGYGNGWHGSGVSVFAVDTGNPVWWSPNYIPIPASHIVTLYNVSSPEVDINNPTTVSGVTRIGREFGDRTHYPIISQNGKFTLWGFNGAPSTMTTTGQKLFINVLKALPLTPPRVAYIYNTDTVSRDDFKSLLSLKGYWADLVPLGSADTFDFSADRAIVVGTDTGYGGSWGTSAAVSHVKAAGKPIVGVGDGGSSLFSQIGLFINWGQSWYDSSASVYAVDATSSIWSLPQPVAVPVSNLVTLYTTATQSLAVYNPTLVSGVTRIGRQTDDANHYPLIAQGNCYLLWGYTGSPATMTLVGKDLFINAMFAQPCSSTSLDLTVSQLEVTQGLQDTSNSIPLIRGKRTVVRAYVGIGSAAGPVGGVTGRLYGYTGGTLLGSVGPFNPGGQIGAPTSPDWHQINQTLNFELPYDWTLNSSLHLVVQANPNHTLAESNYLNNGRSVDITTRACTTINVAYLPIHYTPPGGFTPADPSANIAAGQQFLRKIYPLADTAVIYQPRSGITWSSDLATSDGTLLGNLETLRLNSNPRPDNIYGWLPPLAYWGNGLGYLPGHAAFGNDTETPDRWRRTFAHELGHNYGLNHNSLTTNGRHWFDVYDRVIKPVPASVGGSDLLDFMVPARLEPEAWIAPASYTQLINQLCPLAETRSEQPQAPTAGDNLMVTGLLSHTTPATGHLDALYRSSTIAPSIPPQGTMYTVTLLNKSSQVLAAYSFDVSFQGDGGPVNTMPFGMVVPYPDGLDRVELTASGGTLLDSRIASSAPPTVTLDFPNSAGLTLTGTQTIRWTGSDPDGDPLTYNLLYSRDNGATWIGIASGVTATSYPLNFSSVAGTSTGLIRVQVSDGFYSAEDRSDNPFTVPNKPPMASITSPASGASFDPATTITLQGMGLDLEDGSLGDSALSWTSDREGALGTGQVLQVSLSTGIHAITLTASDSNGLTGTATIQVIVGNAVFLPLVIR